LEDYVFETIFTQTSNYKIVLRYTQLGKEDKVVLIDWILDKLYKSNSKDSKSTKNRINSSSNISFSDIILQNYNLSNQTNDHNNTPYINRGIKLARSKERRRFKGV